MHARDRIEAEIAASGGWISFARYMQLALHEPGVGYYASGYYYAAKRQRLAARPEPK